MSTVPAPRKPIVRAGKRRIYSTSEGRANFAEALGAANEKNTVIGFDRYGKLVAAVVSIDAVRMLAGRGEEVEAAVRDKIERMSRIVLAVAPQVGTPLLGKKKKRLVKKRKPEQKRRRKDKRRKRKGKPAVSKRHRKISRKI